MVFKYKYNDEPICPFCDEEIRIDENELYELYNEETHFITCPDCNKEIEVESNAVWTFSTKKPKD
jgi:Fe2+ or Zn2+ uptake regulation protein